MNSIQVVKLRGWKLLAINIKSQWLFGVLWMVHASIFHEFWDLFWKYCRSILYCIYRSKKSIVRKNGAGSASLLLWTVGYILYNYWLLWGAWLKYRSKVISKTILCTEVKLRGRVWFFRSQRAYNLTMTRMKSSQYLFYIPSLKILGICLVKSNVSQINYVAKMLWKCKLLTYNHCFRAHGFNILNYSIVLLENTKIAFHIMIFTSAPPWLMSPRS